METDIEQHKEVVLGNKQLLSMFFVGAVLLGVAFSMGYIMGKNATVKIGDGNPSAQTSTRARVVDQPPANEDQPGATPAAERPAETSVRESAAPARSAPQSKPVQAAEDAPKAPPATVASDSVSAGSYLQVAALKREDADHVVRMLRTRGFPALLGESSKEGLFRVLVGPFKSMPELSESKQKLRAAGMESIIAH